MTKRTIHGGVRLKEVVGAVQNDRDRVIARVDIRRAQEVVRALGAVERRLVSVRPGGDTGCQS